jgi:hypothetical protein
MIFTNGRVCSTVIFIAIVSSFIFLNALYFSNYNFGIKISQFYLPLCPYSSTINGNRIIFDNVSYFTHHYPEFICPQNFRNMADWVYGWPEYLFDEYVESSINKTKIIVPNLPHGSIIYIKPDSLSSFFSRIYPSLLNKFVLITGQSDISVPDTYLRYLEKIDSKIIHWFGQNGDIHMSKSQRFTHIPIGKNMVHSLCHHVYFF